MQLIGAAATDVNVLQTNAGQARNEDFVADAGISFAGGHDIGAAASNYAYIQLFNPNSSGVTVFVDEITFTSGTDVLVAIRATSSALANGPLDFDPTKLGSAAAVSGIYWAYLTSNTGNVLEYIKVKAGIPFTYRPKYPWVIGENLGMAIATQVVNTALTATFRGREV